MHIKITKTENAKPKPAPLTKAQLAAITGAKLSPCGRFYISAPSA